MSTLGCDFCSVEERAAWIFPAHSIEVPETGHLSVGDWMACEECHRLIEAGDREGLVKRFARAYCRKHPGVTPVEAENDGRWAHGKYFEARIKRPPKRVTASV